LEDRVNPISFGPGIWYQDGFGSIATGDFNGDGILDVATSGLEVFIGKANGSLYPGVQYSPGMDSSVIKTADMNGDGKLDLVVGDNFFESKIGIMTGNGDGTFQEPIFMDLYPVAYPNFFTDSLAIADFNGDGKKDVAVLTESFGVAVLFNNGTPGILSAPTYYSPGVNTAGGMDSADFNGDGMPDLAISTYAGPSNGGQLSIYLNQGAGTFQLTSKYANGTTSSVFGNRDALIANDANGKRLDFNGDGKADLAVNYGGNGFVGIFLGNGDGTFQTQSTFTSGGTRGASYLAAADLDQDGRTDLIPTVSGASGVILLGDGPGHFAPPITVGGFSFSGATGMTAADLNGDGLPDLISSGVTVALNSTGITPAFSSYSLTSPPTSLAGQGFDLTVTALDRTNATANTYTGTIHFTSTDPLATAGNGLPADYTFTAGDNGKHTFHNVILRTGGAQSITGRDTTVATATGSTAVTVNPTSFGNGAGYQGGGGSIATGDFNGDGILDAVTDGLEVFLGTGQGKLAPGIKYSIGIGGQIRVADVNVDGKLDVVVGSTGDARIAVVIGNGDGTFQAPVFTALNPTSYPDSWTDDLVVVDVNGDGKDDVVAWTEKFGIAVLLNTGTGTSLSSPTYYSPGVNGQGDIDAADFNGDGKPDLAVSNFSGPNNTGQISIFLNQGTGTFTLGPRYANGTRPGSHYRDAVDARDSTGKSMDFNGDGKPDLAVNYGANGFVGIFLGNGDGTFRPQATFTKGGLNGGAVNNLDSMAAADLNGDGRTDLVPLIWNGGASVVGVQVLLANGPAHFATAITIGGFFDTGYVTTADMNGDGLPDLLGTSLDSPSSLSVVLNTTIPTQPILNGFTLSAPTATPAGQGFDVTITARDQKSVTFPSYTGTVHFTTTDLQSSAGNGLPADYTFTAADAGVHTFHNVTLKTAGSMTVTVQDTVATAKGSAAVTVNPAAVSAIAAVSGGGQSVTVNTAFAAPLVAKILDPYGNGVPGVTITFTDPATGATAIFPGGATPTTDAAGQVSVPVSANTKAGGYNVSASVAGVASPISFALTNNPGAPANIVAVSGDGQSVTVNTSFAADLVANVTDAFGNPVAGITVTFAGPGNGAGITFTGSSTPNTNSSGDATVSFNANKTAGSYSVTATVTGVAMPASFNLTNTAGAVSNLVVVSGSGQKATVATNFASPLVVQAVDAFGNPVAGETVTFAAPNGGSGPGATFPGGPNSITDSAGMASVVVTANSVVGGYTATAMIAGIGNTASFILTNTTGTPATIYKVHGDQQLTIVNTPFADTLAVKVFDEYGNPVPNVMVTFSGPNNGPGVVFPDGPIETTDATGLAVIPVIANTIAGAFYYPVTAEVSEIAQTVFSLWNAPGAAASISVVSGAGNSAPVNTLFSDPLVARVVDVFGNTVGGVSVTFAGPVTGAGATFPGGPTIPTEADGLATIPVSANTITGSYIVMATASGVAVPATFPLTNMPGTPAAIVAESGSGQSSTVKTVFPSPLVALVIDAFGNSVPGVTVMFAGPGSGASVTFPNGASAVTDAAGRVSVPFAANATAGSYNVTGTVAGVAQPVSFALTNNPGAPSKLITISGGGQSTTVDTTFANPLFVRVVDALGNPVPGAKVSFTGPGSGAGATFLSGVTLVADAAGQVSEAVKANTEAGGYGVTATITGVGSPASFSLTNTAGAAADVAVLLGDDQSVKLHQTFAVPLSVKVTDAFGNPVSGTTVTFSSSAAGAGATFPGGTTPITDAYGTAGVTIAANGAAGTYAITIAVPGVVSPPTFHETNVGPAAALVGTKEFAVGGAGSATLYNPDHTPRYTVTPFAGFDGEIRTAVGDFNGDGVADLVVGTGPGSPTHVRVLDGVDQHQLFSIDPFEASFTGGVFVAVGDLTGDGVADLAISPDEGGGPRVRVFTGNGFKQLADFFGIDDPAFRGGARPALGDVNGDGKADLLVAAGFGGGPRLAVFDGANMKADGGPKLVGDFFAFEQSLRNGVFVTAGDLDGDGFADVIAGGGPGGGPRVFALSGHALLQGNQTPVANFFAGDVESRGGIRIAIKNLDGDEKADLLVGAGAGAGSRVTAYLGANILANGSPPELFAFDAFAGFTGGVFVG
jgi:hypothetical protein